MRNQTAPEAVSQQRTTHFDALLNEAPLGVYLIGADFRIAQVNPIALPVFGDIPELIGRDFDEVIHILWSERYADEIVQLFRHTLETGELYSTPERGEPRLDRGIPEYYEWQISRIPLPDGCYGVVCYFRDISAQVKARTIILESEERFRGLYTDLHAQTEELTRFNRAAVGREVRMIELKKEVNDLCLRNGEAARYPLEFEQDGGTKAERDRTVSP